MPTNDFIGFASAGSANIMSQADYAAAVEQSDGVQPGPASSKFANKVWRQGANMAAALGNIIVDQGGDALDNGDIATLASAIVSAFLGSLSIADSSWSNLYNAYKVKLPNGLMVQSDIVQDATDINSRITITYSEAFISAPNIIVTPWLGSEALVYANNATRAILTCKTSTGANYTTGTNLVYAYIAIGRWK